MTAIDVCGMVHVRVCVRDHGWNRDCNSCSRAWFSS